MNYFKKKSRSLSPAGSIDIPKLSLPKWMRSSRTPQTSPPDHVECDIPSIDDSTEVSAASDSSDAQLVPNASCLDVPISPPRYRSSSFDTTRMQSHCDEEDEGTSLDHRLQVPIHSSRSKSFDAAYCAGSSSTSEDISDKDTPSRVSSFLNIPKYYKRRSLEIPRLCIHCVHLETLSQETSPTSPSHFTYNSGSSKNSLDMGDSFDSTDGDPDDDCVTVTPDVSDSELFIDLSSSRGRHPSRPPTNLNPPVAVTRALDTVVNMQAQLATPVFQDVVTLQVSLGLIPKGRSQNFKYLYLQ